MQVFLVTPEGPAGLRVVLQPLPAPRLSFLSQNQVFFTVSVSHLLPLRSFEMGGMLDLFLPFGSFILINIV